MKKSKAAQLSAIIFAACVGIGSASAEIVTTAKDGDMEGSFAGLSKDTPCFVREPTLFGHGGASPLYPAFMEAGMNVTKDDSASCEVDYRGFVSRHLTDEDSSNVVTTPVDLFYQYPEIQDKLPMVGPALQGDGAVLDKVAGDAVASTKPQSATGESTGAALGGSLLKNVGAAAGGAILGSLFDSKKQSPAGIGHISATITFKNGKDKPSHMEIEVNSASTTKERAVDLLRAVVKRLVVEIQAKEDALKKAEAEKAGTPAAVATITSETPKP